MDTKPDAKKALARLGHRWSGLHEAGMKYNRMEMNFEDIRLEGVRRWD
jgi:hypothetical protein